MHDQRLAVLLMSASKKVPIIRGHATMALMDSRRYNNANDGKGTIDTCEWCKTNTSTANSSMTPKIARFTMSVRHADRSITNGSKGSITKRWIVVAIGMKTKTKRRNKANGNIQHRFSV